MKADEKQSAQEFIDTVMAKGGIIEALDYGLGTENYDLPEAVYEAWDKLNGAFAALEELIDDFEATVEEAGLDFGDE